ncbi:secondary thiamine-phosphate synthase enzyme YjbQ [Candidatus Omnitrophota bacterium]
MMDKIGLRTTKRTELVDITDKVQQIVSKTKLKQGVCFVFVPHTTAGLTINENADPAVKRDILHTLNQLIPENVHYTHSEGNADSHIKSSVFGNSLHIFVESGRLCLGTWQGVFFAESDGPRSREVWIKLMASN